MSMSTNDLKSNKIDLLASVAKSTLGTVPYAGSFISEIVSNIIPNQRIDRIANFCRDLDNRINTLPAEIIDSYLNNSEFIDLLEESFLQASRAFTDERKSYILNLVLNAIIEEKIEIIQSKHLLKILNELNDIEIIWLQHYDNYSGALDKEFAEKHKNVLTKIYAFNKCDDETFIKAAIQDSYLDHLYRLELINKKYKKDTKSKQPKFNSRTGEQEYIYSGTTNLGRLLLKQIGLIDEVQR